MSEQTTPTGDEPRGPGDDPDADPDNLAPRDDREQEEYDGDPDADPGNLNPRDG